MKALLLLAALPALAQEEGIAGRLRTLHDPAIIAHGLSRLGVLVCPRDHGAGVALFRDVAVRIETLELRSFLTATRPLPVPSFTALWRGARAAAVACDPALASDFDRDTSKAKMEEERRLSDEMLDRARARIEENPDRAAQLMQAALSVSDPDTLDIALFTRLLSRLRERSPDLADEVFADAIDYLIAAREPNPSALMELGKYIFVSRGYYDDPDNEQRSETVTAGNWSVTKFELIRRSSSFDDVRQFADAAVKILGSTAASRWYDPVVAFAIARQLLRPGWIEEQDMLDKLKSLYSQLAAMSDASPASVLSALELGTPNLAGMELMARDRGLLAVIAASQAKQFGDARELVRRVNDAAARRIAAELVDFAESADAISRKDLQWATTLANGLRPGVKRALLYAGIAAAAPTREGAFEMIQLGMKDITDLVPEQQMFLFAASGIAAFRLDPDTALMVLGEYVRASNDAYATPRRRNRRVGTTVGPGRGTATILYNRRGLAEVVDDGSAVRYRFPLRVPGVTEMTLAGFLRAGRRADPERLESNVVALKSETQLADGLIALAGMLSQ
jgi:hypothetical protein